MSAWSYSALTAFEQCPKKFAATRVFKTFQEPQGEQLLYGSRVHKSLESFVKANAVLPDDLKHMLPTFEKLRPLGTMVPEKQYALDRSFRLTDYFDKPTTMPDRRVWLRIVVDLQIILRDAPVAVLLDYKTGKEKEDLDQLELFAAVMFALYPQLKEVRTGYWWTALNKVTPRTFEKNEAPVIWQKFMPRVEVLEHTYVKNNWVARPSGLCVKHCPVTDCAFYGKGSH